MEFDAFFLYNKYAQAGTAEALLQESSRWPVNLLLLKRCIMEKVNNTAGEAAMLWMNRRPGALIARKDAEQIETRSHTGKGEKSGAGLFDEPARGEATFSPSREITASPKGPEQGDNLSEFKNSLKSAFSTRSSAPSSLGEEGGSAQSFDIKTYQDKLQKSLGPNVKIQNPDDISRLNGKIPTLSQLNDHFRAAKNDPSIPWEFVNDGCFARSQVTADKVLQNGDNVSKIFAMVDPDAGPADRLKAGNKFSKGSWWYHSAPMVFARDEKTGKVDGYVIDPSVNGQGPVKADEWLKSIWNKKTPVTVDIAPAHQYMPPDEQTGTAPVPFSREEFDKNLKDAKLTNGDYTDVLQWEKEKYYARHPRERQGN